MKRSKHAVAYGECGHSSYGCTCKEFVFDPELTAKKDDEAREAAEELRVDMARDWWVWGLLFPILLFMYAVDVWPQGKDRTFYVTIPVLGYVAIEARGTDRSSALMSLNATVWTEEEWKKCEPCAKSKVIKP